MLPFRKLNMANCKIIVDGNSLTVYGGVNLHDKIKANILTASATCVGFGVSGQNTDSMLVDVQAQIIGAFDPAKTNVVIALELGNQIAANTLGSVAHDKYKQYGLAIREAGGKFIACTAFDRNYTVGLPTPSVRTGINIANNLMRDQWPGYANALVDSQKWLPAVFDNAENRGYWPDGVHYTPAAYNLFAQYCAEVISKVCA